MKSEPLFKVGEMIRMKGFEYIGCINKSFLDDYGQWMYEFTAKNKPAKIQCSDYYLELIK